MFRNKIADKSKIRSLNFITGRGHNTGKISVPHCRDGVLLNWYQIAPLKNVPKSAVLPEL